MPNETTPAATIDDVSDAELLDQLIDAMGRHFCAETRLEDANEIEEDGDEEDQLSPEDIAERKAEAEKAHSAMHKLFGKALMRRHAKSKPKPSPTAASGQFVPTPHEPVEGVRYVADDETGHHGYVTIDGELSGYMQGDGSFIPANRLNAADREMASGESQCEVGVPFYHVAKLVAFRDRIRAERAARLADQPKDESSQPTTHYDGAIGALLSAQREIIEAERSTCLAAGDPKPLTHSQVVPGARVRHKKGGVYTIVGVGVDTETLAELVVYQNDETGFLWIRPAAMFMDGRFQLLVAESTPAPAAPSPLASDGGEKPNRFADRLEARARELQREGYEQDTDSEPDMIARIAVLEDLARIARETSATT